MPSRKRNKGARKAARAKAIDGGDGAPNDNGINHVGASTNGALSRENNACPHFDPVAMRSDRVLRDFMTSFLEATALHGRFESGAVNPIEFIADSMRVAHSKYPNALNDDTKREILKSMFVGAGVTNSLLANNLFGGDGGSELELALLAGNAIATLLIENFDQTQDISYGIGAKTGNDLLKIRDILEHCPLSIVEFFHKRAPCACLKSKYSAVMKQPKTGVCAHCHERKARTCLMVCSRCKEEQYCSRACQVADWPSHRANNCKITIVCTLCSKTQDRHCAIICGRCKEQQYCSRVCQVVDTPAHSANCILRNILYRS